MRMSRLKIESVYNKIEDNKILRSIRNGMVLAVPEIMAGSFALLLTTMPVESYQKFMGELWGGVLFRMLTVVNNATLGIISLIMLLTIGYSYEKLDGRSSGVTAMVSLCSYIAFTYNINETPSLEIFASTRLFTAIVIGVSSSALFSYFNGKIGFKLKAYTDGADTNFRVSISAILPAVIVVSIFAALNSLLVNVFGIEDMQVILSRELLNMFMQLGRNLKSGILFVFFLHFMWFFGIHGGNVMDEVALNVFGVGIDVNIQSIAAGSVPTEIVTKTFMDTFVLFGGCGTALCLLLAIFIAEKRKNIRELSKAAALPVLFNMNEIVIFGVPIVLNPIYFIPFLCTPLLLTVISYGATAMGLVPYAVHEVAWTTPIILSGYAATGSVAGSLLQLFNLGVGTVIYIPFIKLSQKYYGRMMKKQIAELTDVVRKCEDAGIRPVLLSGNSKLSSMAKVLAADLQYAMKNNQLEIFYQPQVNYEGRVTGAEALLRWKYNDGEYLYPPLVIAVAEESGILDELSVEIMDQVCADLKRLTGDFTLPLKLSFNLSSSQLNNPKIFDEVKKKVKKYSIPQGMLGIEITEQTALSGSQETMDRIMEIHDIGMDILMDDFGMGHSSMMYLQDNKFDVVKLDGSLVKEIITNKRCRDIISSIIYLSKSLDFEVIAEYVETVEQRDELKKLGCECYQGYLYSPAVKAEEFIDFVRNYEKL